MPLSEQITNTPTDVTDDGVSYVFASTQPVYKTDTEDLSAAVTNALANVPGSSWGATPPTSPADGAVWFDSSNGYRLHRYDAASGTWVDVQDAAIAAAATAATAANTAANGKNNVFRQGYTPTAKAVGDLWYNTSNGNAMYSWDGSSWQPLILSDSALASISGSKITAGTINAGTVSVINLNAANISTGYLAASRIATASLDASVLNAGTINASVVYAGNIAATQISAGTLGAGVIYAGSITADKISSGTLSTATLSITSSSYSVKFGSQYSYAYLDASPGNSLGITLNGVGFYSTTYSGWTSHLYPYSDNYKACGVGSSAVGPLRWSAVYAATGTIQTSDARLKTDITDAALGLDFIKKLRPVSYKWISGGNVPVLDANGAQTFDSNGRPVMESVAGKRTHWGFIAQEVKAVVDASGVADFAGWVLDDITNPDSTQSINYAQFVSPLTKAIQELAAKVDALEVKVNG